MVNTDLYHNRDQGWWAGIMTWQNLVFVQDVSDWLWTSDLRLVRPPSQRVSQCPLLTSRESCTKMALWLSLTNCRLVVPCIISTTTDNNKSECSSSGFKHNSERTVNWHVEILRMKCENGKFKNCNVARWNNNHLIWVHLNFCNFIMNWNVLFWKLNVLPTGRHLFS